MKRFACEPALLRSRTTRGPGRTTVRDCRIAGRASFRRSPARKSPIPSIGDPELNDRLLAQGFHDGGPTRGVRRWCCATSPRAVTSPPGTPRWASARIAHAARSGGEPIRITGATCGETPHCWATPDPAGSRATWGAEGRRRRRAANARSGRPASPALLSQNQVLRSSKRLTTTAATASSSAGCSCIGNSRRRFPSRQVMTVAHGADGDGLRQPLAEFARAGTGSTRRISRLFPIARQSREHSGCRDISIPTPGDTGPAGCPSPGGLRLAFPQVPAVWPGPLCRGSGSWPRLVPASAARARRPESDPQLGGPPRSAAIRRDSKSRLLRSDSIVLSMARTVSLVISSARWASPPTRV